VQAATAYYGAYPGEIDERIELGRQQTASPNRMLQQISKVV
jgi:hypothetical protein